MTDLIPPHGGELVDLLVADGRAAELGRAALELPSWKLTDRQQCDLELLATGGFSPLTGFLGREDHESVVTRMRLADDTLWPIPVTLDVPEGVAESAGPGERLALRDTEGLLLAVLTVRDRWVPDPQWEAEGVFGTIDTAHPGVAHLLERSHPFYLGGDLEVVRLPQHHDFLSLRQTPVELRARFAERDWKRVVAFQTRNPMHRAHVELTRRAAHDVDANLLIHPVVGLTKPGDVDHYTRVRCYLGVLDRYPEATADLSLLNLAMRMGGPREALWHAIIRKNHGATHLIVGRDHAGPRDRHDRLFYGQYDAQDLLREHEEELGIEMVPFRMVVYLPEANTYAPVDEVPEGAPTAHVSGTELRGLLAAGAEIPEWFTFPEVAAELRRRYPPRHTQGLAIFLTGLSGAGKSTVAKVLLARLLEVGNRKVTLLDGDHVRQHLSSELGFSKEHRDLNIRRIGFVAAEIARNGGIALCAPIAPYDAARRQARDLVESAGGSFLLVHISTPLEVCEQRDPKGLYAKARSGLLSGFTGIDDPYQAPTDAHLDIDTTNVSPAESAERILDLLRSEGWLPGEAALVGS
ncbi:MAG: bifunctional sulfate adenylyltransferase/adenylylsulfate kinase [Nitriliruptorales bacterium]